MDSSGRKQQQQQKRNNKQQQQQQHSSQDNNNNINNNNNQSEDGHLDSYHGSNQPTPTPSRPNVSPPLVPQQQQQQRYQFNDPISIAALNESLMQQISLTDRPTPRQHVQQQSHVQSQQSQQQRLFAPAAVHSLQNPAVSLFPSHQQQQSFSARQQQSQQQTSIFPTANTIGLPIVGSRPTVPSSVEEYRNIWTGPPAASARPFVRQSNNSDYQHDADYGLFSGGMNPISLAFMDSDSTPSHLNVQTTTTSVSDTTSRSTRPTTESSSSSGETNISSTALTVKFPVRPGSGQKGRTISVKANFFEFSLNSGREIYHYELKITPEVPPNMNRKIFKQFVDTTGSHHFDEGVAVFDGRRNVYTPMKIVALEKNNSNWQEFEVLIRDEFQEQRRDVSFNNSRSFTIKIRFQSIIDLTVLFQYLNGSIRIDQSNSIQGKYCYY